MDKVNIVTMNVGKLAFCIFLTFGLIASYNADLQEDNQFQCRFDALVEGSLPTRSPQWAMADLKQKFLSSALPWPETDSRTPQLMFAVKGIQSARGPDNRRFVLQLGLKDINTDTGAFIFGHPVDVSPAISNALNFTEGLFNCFIDRSDRNPCPRGATNPRCCYSSMYSSIQDKLSTVYPACTVDACPDLPLNASPIKYSTFSCRAICSYDAIIQVELGDSAGQAEGGTVGMSMISSRVSLAQRDGQFTEIENDLGDNYFKCHTDERGSNINSDFVVGFWVRWIDGDNTQGPILEIGGDGSEMPFFSHKFDEFCFDCLSQDQYGWYGLDVQLPKANHIFKPKFWSLDALQGNSFRVFTDCKNVIYSRHQPQPELGGTCLNNLQCTKMCPDSDCTLRKCMPSSNRSFPWMNSHSCQIPSPPDFPLEIAIIFFLLGLVILFGYHFNSMSYKTNGLSLLLYHVAILGTHCSELPIF
jgi:hypothetical protein